MWPFKKKKKVIDLSNKGTGNSKSGTLKSGKSNNKYTDLTSSEDQNMEDSKEDSSGSALGFLGNVSSKSKSSSSTSNLSSSRDLKSISDKIDDLDSTLKRLSSRIGSIQKKLDVFERKLERR